MIDKRGKELLAKLRDSTPEVPPEMDKEVFTARDRYRRALERITHILAHLPGMSATEKLGAIKAITEHALKE